ncbi:glycosyltransferase [uncultured Methanospirillum sp.]|uniref:glycosyltransferase n=1 Tax=uncultured Methanospirillum sp. TaxID=262503 RepID=UPI003748AB2D
MDFQDPEIFGSTRIWRDNLSKWLMNSGCSVTQNCWDRLESYDIIIFGKYSNPDDIIRCISKNQLIGLVNPPFFDKRWRPILRKLDFIIVGSVEEKDYCLQFNTNVFIIPLVERMFIKEKIHVPNVDGMVTLGYHGNMEHLHQFYPNISAALDELSDFLLLKLNVIYNIRQHGIWTYGRPKKIQVVDIQIDSNTIEDELLKIDIGLCPGLNNPSHFSFKVTELINRFLVIRTNPHENDYIIRFKQKTNAGRSFVFHQLGIPVISDFTPSNFHILSDPECGYLAHYKEGWKQAIIELAESPQMRQIIANNAKERFNELYDPIKWTKEFLAKIDKIKKTS